MHFSKKFLLEFSLIFLIIILFIGFFIFLKTKNVTTGGLSKHEPMSEQEIFFQDDLYFRFKGYLEADTQDFSFASLPKIGDSYDRAVDLLGDDYIRRLSFLKTQKLTVGSSTFKFNRLLDYSEVKYNYASKKFTKDGKTFVSSGGWPYDFWKIAVFFHDDIVTHVGAIHQTRSADGAEVVLDSRSFGYITEYSSKGKPVNYYLFDSDLLSVYKGQKGSDDTGL